MENKKRRLGRNPVDELLPDALLLKVISYLPRENRLLFAVALTAPSHNWRCRRRGRRHSGPSPKSSMVLTLSNTDWRNDWGEFDFGNVALAAGRRYFPLGGLSDDDLRAALLCIDAKNTVRSLKLSKCYGLSGKGLEPLRESKILQRVDLSLVGKHDDPCVYVGVSKLKVKEVVPILFTIITLPNCNLRHVQFPAHWRRERKHQLTCFLFAYNGMLDSAPNEPCRNIQPSSMSNSHVPCQNNSLTRMGLDGRKYGIQDNECFNCGERFCYTCQVDNYGCIYCPCCERDMCRECAEGWDVCRTCGIVVKCDNCCSDEKVETLSVHCESCYEYCCRDCKTVNYNEEHDCFLCRECLNSDWIRKYQYLD